MSNSVIKALIGMVVGSAAVGSARAVDTIYSNLTSAQESPYQSPSSRNVARVTSTENGTAYSFVARTTGRLSEIDLMIWASAGTSMNATLSSSVPGCGTLGYRDLCTGSDGPDFGNVPGVDIGSWSVTFPSNPADRDGDKATKISGITGIVLVAGTEYFLRLAKTGSQSSSSSIAWSGNLTGATGNLWQCGGHTDFTFSTCIGYISYADVQTGAMAYFADNSPVPEPAPLALILAGAMVLAFRRAD